MLPFLPRCKLVELFLLNSLDRILLIPVALEAPFIHVPYAPRPKISSERASYQQTGHKLPIHLHVANNNIRDHGHDKHDAAPPQHAPIQNEGSFAVPPLLLPCLALPVEHREFEYLEHLRISIRKCKSDNRDYQAYA
jgi:hypothetical protein